MGFRSPLGKVKGLGSAKSGSHHWWLQRITAVALIPLVVWFVLFVIKASVSGGGVIGLLESPFHAVGLILFLIISLYHGCLGLRVVIEDYVHCNCGRPFLIFVVQFVTVVTIVASVLAVAKVHVGSFGHHRYHKTNEGGEELERDRHMKWREQFYKRFHEESGGTL